MKKNIYIKWMSILPIALGMLFSGCSDSGFDNMNTNPHSSSDMDPNLQLTKIQLMPSNDAEAWHRYFIYPGGYMNQWTNDWAVVTYGGAGVTNDGYFSQAWTSIYPQIITDVVDMVERTRDVELYSNIHAIGRILKVQNFLKLTDFYGDIPYFDAAKAFHSGIFKPKYDKQEDIYKDFLKELKEAASQLNTSKAKPTADIYYNGDIDKWRKFANSLRLRIAMRLIKVEPTLAKSESEEAVKAGVFTSNADICFIRHEKIQTTDPSAGNGVANRLLTDNKSSTFRLTQELIGIMEDLKDPRIRIIAGSYLEDEPRTDITNQLFAYYGSYKKFTLGAQLYSYDEIDGKVPVRGPITLVIDEEDVAVPALFQYMQPSKLITDPGSPFIHMSYAEVEFLLAEAVKRGYSVGGTAQDHYKKGLAAAVNQWTLFGEKIDPAVVAKFVDDNPMQSGKELEQINTQLWILHFLDPFETWANWRRTGLPDIKFYNYRKNNESEGKTPRRLQYPVSEQVKNPEAYKEAVARLGADNWLKRVWWDKE